MEKIEQEAERQKMSWTGFGEKPVSEKEEDEEFDVEEDEIFDDKEDEDELKELIANSTAGVVYDWRQAPDSIPAPERENLDGKIVRIERADIILPPKESNWLQTRFSSKRYKPCTFKLYYEGGQQEFYSGVKVFERGEKYSHPTIYKEGKNQAARLFQAYAKFLGKNPREISLKQFMAGLNSGSLKGRIESMDFENPDTGEKIRKNIVVEFVN